MEPRDRDVRPAAGRLQGTAWAQARLPFGRNRPARDEAKLLDALTRALSVLDRSCAAEVTLRDSFVDAVAGLGAEKGVLVQVREETPADIEIVCTQGLSPEDQDACRSLRSCPGISPTLIKKTLETGEPTLLGDSSAGQRPDTTGSFRGRPYSIVCAPVSDSLTGSVAGLLYFQNDATFPFKGEDLRWVSAYAAALGQALTLHLSGQRPIPELQAEWKRIQDGGPEILGDSEATRKLGAQLTQLLPSTVLPNPPPILVLGESGTGKEVVAQYVHHFSSKRGRGPFVSFNCAGLRGDLAESKLFGHVRGAFTGAVGDSPGLFRAADKGVLFLDEIGEMPLEGQALLLRVLETRKVQAVGDPREIPVDVQLVLATNRALQQEIVEKRFREDLYYRISGLRVELRPLRDPTRVADIKHLLAFYLAKQERLLKKKTLGLTPVAARVLLRYSWPGNVRELSTVCMRLITYATQGEWIDEERLRQLVPEVVAGPKNPNPEAYVEDETLRWNDALRALKLKLIFGRLASHGGDGKAAARSLGLPVSTFYRYWRRAKQRG